MAFLEFSVVKSSKFFTVHYPAGYEFKSVCKGSVLDFLQIVVF